MPLKTILKLIGLRPVSVRKRKPKAKRCERQAEKWKPIGRTFGHGVVYEKDLDQVPEWLQKEWSRIRGTTRTLSGRWKICGDLENPEPNNFNEGYSSTGYFRNGMKYRYMVVDWEGMLGSGGTDFYRKRRRL